MTPAPTPTSVRTGTGDIDRRRVLRVLGSGGALATAGCVGKVGSLVGLGGMAVIEDVSPGADPEVPVTPTVEVATRRATPDQPATLHVQWTNTSDRYLRLGDAKNVLFHNTSSIRDTVYTAVLDESRTDNVTGFSGCWQFTSDRIGGPAVAYTTSLSPGETHEGRTGLYSMSGCHAAGTYTLRTGVGTDDIADSSRDENGTWEVDVTLSVA